MSFLVETLINHTFTVTIVGANDEKAGFFVRSGISNSFNLDTEVNLLAKTIIESVLNNPILSNCAGISLLTRA